MHPSVAKSFMWFPGQNCICMSHSSICTACSTDLVILGLIPAAVLGTICNVKYKKLKFMRWHLEWIPILWYQPQQHSRYASWLQAGQPRCRSSSPGRVKNVHFSILSRPALGPTQHPMKWVLGVKQQVKNMWIYASIPPIHLDDDVLNLLMYRHNFILLIPWN
jgi:hypothetical protein